MTQKAFSQRILDWFDAHGRKDLPWQRQPSPYRVWVSEIMLQQTRVGTVIPYFQRFTASFPDLLALADAPEDEVLHHWSGLGYYARARNLHRAAREVRDRYAGELPRDLEQLHTLPGIGRSTAGAILSLALGQRHPILDGNAKRVLARCHAVDGWPGQSAVLQRLWELAEIHTPDHRVAAYNQAMMDLGATLCTRGRPACDGCPVEPLCRARALGEQGRYPTPKPARPLPVRRTRVLVIRNSAGRLLLEQRPPSGIWGGLWSLPECPPESDVEAWCADRFGLRARVLAHWAGRRHTFSHFHLDMVPVELLAYKEELSILESDRRVWYNLDHPDRRGLAAPVARLIAELQTRIEGETP
jgi:A/G-specific adenine glycosylase